MPSVVALQPQHLLEHVEHLVVADVIDRRELRLQCGADSGRRRAECGAGVDERLREHRRDVEIAQFVVEVACPAPFDCI